MDIFGIPIDPLLKLVSVALTVILGIVGPKIAKYKRLLRLIADAVEDNEITEAETKKIVKAVKVLF